MTDFGVAGRDSGNLCDAVLVVVNLFGKVSDFLDNFVDGFFDAVFQVGRIGAGGDVLETFMDDCLGEDGSSGSSVAGDVIGFAGNFFNQLSAHVFELVGHFDFFGDGDAVVGDGRAAEFLVENGVAAFRAKGGADCVGDDVNAGFE